MLFCVDEVSSLYSCFFFFFFNDTATTEIYTLSLHDALPIPEPMRPQPRTPAFFMLGFFSRDRKSTRLNSSHVSISYAVFCLKKKNSISLCYYHHDYICSLSCHASFQCDK